MIHILPTVIQNTKSDKFTFVEHGYPVLGNEEVYFNGRVIAALNTFHGALSWVESERRKLPKETVTKLEQLVLQMIQRSNPPNHLIFVTVEEFLFYGGELEDGREIYFTPKKDGQIGIYDSSHDSNDGCIPVKNSYKYFQMYKDHVFVQIFAKPIYK